MGVCSLICYIFETVLSVFTNLTAALTAFILISSLLLTYYIAKLCRSLSLTYASSNINEYLCRNTPEFFHKHCPTLFLANGHLQTLYYDLESLRNFDELPIKYKRDLIPLSDGGEISIDWAVGVGNLDSPIIVLIPGLTGGKDDMFADYFVEQAKKRNFQIVLLNHRGCSQTALKVLSKSIINRPLKCIVVPAHGIPTKA